jgi:hypothetical protein
MKDRKKMVPHFIAVITFCFFGVLALGSTATTKKAAVPDVTETTVVSSETTSTGKVYHLPGPEGKPYTTLGMVFATTTTEYNEKGNEITSQEGITTMLLREAHKLGADDIFNLRVDQNITWVATVTTTEDSSSTKTETVMTKTVTYTGSALAIKYVN